MTRMESMQQLPPPASAGADDVLDSAPFSSTGKLSAVQLWFLRASSSLRDAPDTSWLMLQEEETERLPAAPRGLLCGVLRLSSDVARAGQTNTAGRVVGVVLCCGGRWWAHQASAASIVDEKNLAYPLLKLTWMGFECLVRMMKHGGKQSHLLLHPSPLSC